MIKDKIKKALSDDVEKLKDKVRENEIVIALIMYLK